MDGLSYAYWAVVAATAIFSVLLTWQAWEHRRYARSRSLDAPRMYVTGHVAVFVPCKGVETDLEPNLRPLFEQDYNDYELIFAVEAEDDPSLVVIQQLIKQHPGVESRVVVAGLCTTSGQKVHNLRAATENLPPHIEILVFVDADVRPPRDWLRMLTERMDHVDVTSGYRCFVPKRPTLANCALASINAAVVPIMFPGKHHLIWGGSWAITRAVFDQSGLRDDWQGTLSDDLVATRTMARLKHRVAAEPNCILPSPLEVDWVTMLGFLRRQLMIGRCYVPVLWVALILGTLVVQSTFWGSLVASIWGFFAGATWAAEPALAVSGLYALHLLRAHFRHTAAGYYLPYRKEELAPVWRFDSWLGPLSGLIGLVALISSAFGNRIVWKGITYEIGPQGSVRGVTRPDDARNSRQLETECQPASFGRVA